MGPNGILIAKQKPQLATNDIPINKSPENPNRIFKKKKTAIVFRIKLFFNVP